MTTLAQRVRRYLGRKELKEVTKDATDAVARASDAALPREIGYRPTPDRRTIYLYQRMWVEPDFRSRVLDVRDMDQKDGRVKKIHGRMARTAIKGGLILRGNPSATIRTRWDQFSRRLNLHRREKLESDARGLVMEGNLPMQWVLTADNKIGAGVRMPSETIKPRVNQNGIFIDPAQAYEQVDFVRGDTIARFALWQMTLARMTPDNYDDQGCMGRPYLDSARSIWKKLAMTEEDLVLRRRDRAPLRFVHTLEGATGEELEDYEGKLKQREHELSRDFFLNKKGGVTALQGDSNLDQIADVSYLLDTFFAGSPAPKGLFGYAEGLNRDILEDMKRDYFEEIDSLQDTLSFVYQMGFHIDLLFSGVDPDAADFQVVFAERNTETLSQRTDRALKMQALGFPNSLCWETAGGDTDEILARRTEEQNSKDPYPQPEQIGAGPNVNVTPSNARKGQSATTISTRT